MPERRLGGLASLCQRILPPKRPRGMLAPITPREVLWQHARPRRSCASGRVRPAAVCLRSRAEGGAAAAPGDVSALAEAQAEAEDGRDREAELKAKLPEHALGHRGAVASGKWESAGQRFMHLRSERFL